MGINRFDNDYAAYLGGQEEFRRDPTATGVLIVESTTPLTKHVDPMKLQSRMDRLAEMRYEKAHLQYLGTLNKFDASYLEHLDAEPPLVRVLAKDSRIKVVVEGLRSDLPIWETPVSEQIRDLYYAGVMQADGLDLDALVGEGIRRFQVKGDMLRNSGVRFVEAGTRFRYGFKWHSLLITLILGDMHDLLLGTTNLGMAMAFGLDPVANLAPDVVRIAGPSVRELEALYDGEGRPIVVTGVNAFQMAHLFGHFGDRITFEWDRDLTGDMGPAGTFLPLICTTT